MHFSEIDEQVVEDAVRNSSFSSSEEFILNQDFINNFSSEADDDEDDDYRKCAKKFAKKKIYRKYCKPVWDTIHCWPPTAPNQIVSVQCTDIIDGLDPRLTGGSEKAYRICDNKGEWLWGNWSNYTECARLLEIADNEESLTPEETITIVSYIGFIGSIVSLVCLLMALGIFCYFKSLQCSRLSVHKNFVFSLILRFVLMIIVTEPSVSGRKESFVSVEWLCKFVLTLKLYSLLTNVNWMFVEGFYLHSRITVSVFNSEAPFALFYLIGWGLPLIYITVWVTVMESQMSTFCWLGYSKTPYVWILTVPMSIALLLNLLFLINIVRILITKLRATKTRETTQFVGVGDGKENAKNDLVADGIFQVGLNHNNNSKNMSTLMATRKAIKASAVLFPLLGITNLFFFINPNDDGKLEDAYFIINSILQSSQGIFVAVLYCFLNTEIGSSNNHSVLSKCLDTNLNSLSK
ncbi:hypothetical protein CHUAL_013617 [Chamberlinius hualienensis]